MPSPSKFIFKSSDGSVSAISDPEATTTKIIRTADQKLLWEIPGWESVLFVANDGRHVVAGYRGGNLIPVEYDERMVLFTFWREGKKVREVTLKEFVSNRGKPIRTTSHYHWGCIDGIDISGNLIVLDANDKTFRYNLKTGLEVK
jgi:hypothetical protein